MLRQLPALAFDWADPLGQGGPMGVGAGGGGHGAHALSREDVVALFKRLDTDKVLFYF